MKDHVCVCVCVIKDRTKRILLLAPNYNPSHNRETPSLDNSNINMSKRNSMASYRLQDASVLRR